MVYQGMNLLKPMHIGNVLRHLGRKEPVRGNDLISYL